MATMSDEDETFEGLGWSALPPEDRALHDMLGSSYPLEDALRMRGLLAEDDFDSIDPNKVLSPFF